jgi:hypothetical protein
MIERSFGETDAAASLATASADRALVFFQEAQGLHTFGLAVDALVELRRAASVSQSPGIAHALQTEEAQLRSGGRE